MVQHHPRRRIIELATVGLGAFLAGCLGAARNDSEDEGGDTTTDTPADSNTGTPIGKLDQLSLGAAVETQPSQETPGTIRTGLLNTGNAPVEIGTVPTLVFRKSDVSTQEILLYPRTFIGPNTTPTEPSNGCWRYTDDNFLVQTNTEFHTIDPGEAFTETHQLYTYGEEPECLPSGDYTLHDEVVNREKSQSLWLTINIQINEQKQISVSAIQEKN